MKILKPYLILWSLILLTGCSSLNHRTEVITYGAGFPSEALSGGSELSWHAIRFRMPFGPEEQVNWDMDLLLAHGVLGLMIAENRDGLPLWRFHRRAARDSTGHQLSLLFYSDESTANMLFDWIESDPIIESAKSAGLLTGLINKAEAFENASSIAATSDRSWDPAIQRQWPSFIMGVSATWLGLIEELLPDAETEKETLDQKLARYHLANERLTELWREQGQHAFLHHLNALFGYEALLIQRYMRF